MTERKFDWGDGTDTGWLGPYESDETLEVSNNWTSIGSYQIKVKIKDAHGAESEWSDPLGVFLPKSKNMFFKLFWIFPNLKILYKFLQNF